MIKHTFDDIYTGGGFHHYWVTFPDYGIGVLMNEEGGGSLPKDGERFDIGVYHLENGKDIGEHFDDSFNTLENFWHTEIVCRVFGYCEAKGYIKQKKSIKKFLCIWNEGSDSEVFEVHSLLSLWENYKRTNLYEDEFAENWGGDTFEQCLDVMALNQKVTFDNLEVTRIR